MTLPHLSLGWSELLDAVDIAVTAYIVYLVLVLIRGTRAVQILQGLALLVGLRLLAQWLHLWTVFSLLNGLLIVSGVAIPVVFQPELRRALASLGRAGFLEPSSPHGEVEIISRMCSVVGRTAAILSRAGLGAIIVLERNTGLTEYCETGTPIDALASPELLLSLFATKSPLHDGAVIMRRDRVVAAGCFLPLSDAAPLERRVGTRHRAALGVTEQTDAVAVVVSEENGGVCIARDGLLSSSIMLDDVEIATAIKNIFLRPPVVKTRSRNNIFASLQAILQKGRSDDEAHHEQLRT